MMEYLYEQKIISVDMDEKKSTPKGIMSVSCILEEDKINLHKTYLSLEEHMVDSLFFTNYSYKDGWRVNKCNNVAELKAEFSDCKIEPIQIKMDDGKDSKNSITIENSPDRKRGYKKTWLCLF